MKKLIMTKGLPASGKSTWAIEEVENNIGRTKRVNKDDLRMMLDSGIWTGGNEKFVLRLRNYIIEEAFGAGKNIIVDDTNLNPIHERDLREIAKHCNSQFEIKDFTNVSVEECVRRDLKRNNSVGAGVIYDMYNHYLKPEVEPVKQIEFNPELPYIYLCDIDGTLALKRDRSPYDMTKVMEDEPNRDVIKLIKNVWMGTEVVFMSGRTDDSKANTLLWLDLNLGTIYKHVQDGEDIPMEKQLYMRAVGDMRKDSIVKKELYEKYIKDKYNVIGVFDDRKQVVDMWRELGITCFQVAEGNF